MVSAGEGNAVRVPEAIERGRPGNASCKHPILRVPALPAKKAARARP